MKRFKSYKLKKNRKIFVESAPKFKCAAKNTKILKHKLMLMYFIIIIICEAKTLFSCLFIKKPLTQNKAPLRREGGRGLTV